MHYEPLLILYHSITDSGLEQIILKNEGKGVAFNVKIDSIKINNKMYELDFLRPLHYFSSGDTKVMHINKSAKILQKSFDIPLSEFVCTVWQNNKKEVRFILYFNSIVQENNKQEFKLVISKDYPLGTNEIIPV